MEESQHPVVVQPVHQPSESQHPEHPRGVLHSPKSTRRAVSTARARLEKLRGGQEKLQADGDFDPQEVYADRLEQIYNVYYDLFKSERVYGANLENLDAVKEVIDHIAHVPGLGVEARAEPRLVEVPRHVRHDYAGR